MTGVEAIVEAARRELGDMVQAEPVRASCSGCGRFLVAVMVVPNLLRDRCERCRADVIVLVTRTREVIVAIER